MTEAELRSMKEDAERYRYLRDRHTIRATGQGGDWTHIEIRLERETDKSIPVPGQPGVSTPVFLTFDQAVDACRKEKP